MKLRDLFINQHNQWVDSVRVGDNCTNDGDLEITINHLLDEDCSPSHKGRTKKLADFTLASTTISIRRYCNSTRSVSVVLRALQSAQEANGTLQWRQTV